MTGHLSESEAREYWDETARQHGLLEARDPMLDAIYAEGDPIIWLRVDLYRTARRAKHVAWSGEGIPYGFREDGARLKDLKVSRVWMRDDGAKNGYDQWWTQVNVTDVADLTEFFRVESVDA